MNSTRKLVGLLMVLAFAVFALPASAAGPAKIFGLTMSPSTVTSNTQPLTATFSNLTPNGNSVINTVILTPPNGLTATATFPNGGNKVTCPATTVNSAGQTVAVPGNSICVANIPSVMKAGCSPTACSWTMNVAVTLPNSCGVFTWAGQAFAGNSFNGDVFAYQSGSSSVTTTINAGCNYNINVSISPAGGGTVSCTSNPVSYGGSSTCTATAGSGFSFSGFSGDCTGSTCVLTNVTATKNVTANFAHLPNAVTTTVLPAGSGTLTCTPNPVPWDTSTTCTVVAGSGYGFVNFSGDCSGTSCTLNNVTSPRSVTANFAQNAITATASPAAGGSVTCTPNPVPYGGNSSCTASASSLYTFTGFSGDCTGGTCSFTNMTTNKSVTANFVSNTLAITSAPSSAAVGTPFDVTIGSTPTGANVSFSAGCDASSSKTTLGDGSTKFTITINTLPSPPSTCTLTFSAPNYNPIPLNNLQVYKGVLACGDYDSSLGKNNLYLDPDADKTYILPGSSGWGLRRGPNKDGSDCVKVNYSCDLDGATNIAACSFDKASGQPATFKYVFVWNAVSPNVDGWKDYRPLISWGIPNPGAPALYNWMPALACIDDMFPSLPTLPTTILPTIPAQAPWTDSGNTSGQYVVGNPAWVCVAQQGSTSVGAPSGPVLLQFWHKVIDEADVLVKGPS
jgi:hypothetical protein